MFIDTSVIIAILSREEDAADLASRLETASSCMTSALVILEATMRLSSKFAIHPAEAEAAIDRFLEEAAVDVVPIDRNDGKAAVRAFAEIGKGRGHPAQLNLADCLSYACATNRNQPLLYKGSDFSHTDLG